MLQQERIADSANPLAVYINVPFCSTACSFCHYLPNLRFRHDFVPTDYLDVLQRQWLAMLDHFPTGRSLVSLYMGGGTPSLLTGEQFDRLLNPLDERGVLTEERTLEIHPGTWSHLAVNAQYSLTRFNRFSIGVQTFNADRLRLWARQVYAFRDIDTIISSLRSLQSDVVINVDLLFEATVDHSDLRLAAALAPDTITLYPRTGRKQPGAVRDLYLQLHNAAETLSEYKRLNPRSFIFLRQWTARSRHAMHEYESAGDVLGLGHMAVSNLGDYSYRSCFAGSDWRFERKQQGTRYRKAVLRAIPYGVAPSLVEMIDSALFKFLAPHPDLTGLLHLRLGEAVTFETFLIDKGWAHDDINEFRRTLTFGDSASELLQEVDI